MIKRMLPLLGATMILSGINVALAQDAEPRYPRMYSVNYDPWLEVAHRRVSAYGGWNDPTVLNQSYFSDFKSSSHGLLNWRHTVELRMDEYPLLASGQRYDDATYKSNVDSWSGWYNSMVNYKMLTVNYDFARRVEYGEIDEVNNNCPPFYGYWETTMCGYGGYWCNSSPQQRVASERIFVILGLNYERGVAEMLHSNCHRVESIMRRVYGSWSMNNPQHLWDRFTMNDGGSPSFSVFGVGNCHFPPNGVADYDYANTNFVNSVANLWLTMDPGNPGDFPDLTGSSTSMNRETWGGPDYHRNYMNFFYERVPHFPGTNNEDGYTRLNNWWIYTNFFNEDPNSNGGDLTILNTRTPDIAYPRPQYQVSTDTTDDWRPAVNSFGRVVWAGHKTAAQPVMTIYSADHYGADLTQVSNGIRVSEMPQINDAGQIAYQYFNSKVFEIWTASADGSTTPIKVSPDTPYQAWHVDINNSGRIVWEQFDGEDYEIYSANWDGTDVVQITDNTHGGSGRPRDDMWPRINDNNEITWMGYDGGNYEIWTANADGTGITKISSSGTYENEYPQISNSGKVVWHAWHTDSNAEVYSANVDGSNFTRHSTNGIMDWWPQVNDNGDVVWQQRATDWEIMLNGAALTANTTHDQMPVIDNAGRIAWQGWDGDDWEIFIHEEGITYQVTNNDYDDRAPNLVTGSPLVWHGESWDDPDASLYSGPTTEIFAVLGGDNEPPVLVDAQAFGNDTRVIVDFNEALKPDTAEDPANYAIDQGVSVSAASLTPDGRSVVLTTSPLSSGTDYVVTVNNISDSSLNVIAPDSTADFAFGDPTRPLGPLALYAFDEGSGSLVYDVSGYGTPLDLTIANQAGTTQWLENGLLLFTGTSLSGGLADKINTACAASDAVTIEAWVSPLIPFQSGPARIVAVSDDAASANAILAQGRADGGSGAAFTGRVRSSGTNADGSPGIETAPTVATTNKQHLLLVAEANGALTLYVDGVQVATGTLAGDFSAWTATAGLTLGSDNDGSNPFLGIYHLVAIYDRALPYSQALASYEAGSVIQPTYADGDLNCDGVIDTFDIDAFILAQSGQAAYEAAFPNCDFDLADMNADGSVDTFDIDPFIAALSG